MTEKNGDENIQKITKLLEKGGTMLANHHECGAPMFRYQGKIVCPVCDFKDKSELKAEQRTRQSSENKPLSDIDMETIKQIILKKTSEIAGNLDNETDLSRVKEELVCIEQGIKVLKLIQEL